MYADKRANAKPSPIQEGDMVLLRQEKKNKLSTPFEGIPYTVFQKKGSMVTAERTTDGIMVTRKTKDFKSCPSSTKQTTQATLSDKADDAIVAEKSPSGVDVAEQTSEMPQPISVASSPHPPSAEEPRYPRRERHKPARFKDYLLWIDTKMDHLGTQKELSSPNIWKLNVTGHACLYCNLFFSL